MSSTDLVRAAWSPDWIVGAKKPLGWSRYAKNARTGFAPFQESLPSTLLLLWALLLQVPPGVEPLSDPAQSSR
jgi:hypothetical protein